jgi:hypothetical protein
MCERAMRESGGWRTLRRFRRFVSMCLQSARAAVAAYLERVCQYRGRVQCRIFLDGCGKTTSCDVSGKGHRGIDAGAPDSVLFVHWRACVIRGFALSQDTDLREACER